MTEPVRPRAPGPAAANTEEVHFYPGSKIMVYVAGNTVKQIAEAWGGPATKQARRPTESMAAGPTTAGVFTIDGLETYRTNSWQFSKIAWGTPIRANRLNTRKLEYLSPSGKWRPSTIMITEDVRAKGHIKKTRRLLDVNDVLSLNRDLRGSRDFPETWLFNDFGPIAVRYYRDSNRNRKRDANESLSGEMIHTTDVNESESYRSQGDSSKVFLFDSHGCIHIKPADRDAFIRAGALRKGMALIIHSYDDLFDPDRYE
jgi:hypothetical protein